MRYTIEREKEVKKLAEEGKSLEYISSLTGIPQKVIWNWCPNLRPHDDIIKQSVKQRYHFIYPDLEAKISNAFSPFVRRDISEKDWEEINKVIYDTLYEESLYVFKNVITDPPDFGEIRRLAEDNFLDFIKSFWTENSDYAVSHSCSKSYLDMQRNSVHYWSALRKKKLKEITKGDVEIIHEKLRNKNLSDSRINSILKTGLVPLKYAFDNGLTLLKTYEYPLPKIKTKQKLSNETKLKIISAKWKSQESFVANLIAYATKMNIQEIRALKLFDIVQRNDFGFIISSHVFTSDHKYIENKYKRMVKVPIQIINIITKYASTSPYKDYKPDDFIFYSRTLNRDLPSPATNWTKDLKKVCKAVIGTDDVSFSIWT